MNDGCNIYPMPDQIRVNSGAISSRTHSHFRAAQISSICSGRSIISCDSPHHFQVHSNIVRYCKKYCKLWMMMVRYCKALQAIVVVFSSPHYYAIQTFQASPGCSNINCKSPPGSPYTCSPCHYRATTKLNLKNCTITKHPTTRMSNSCTSITKNLDGDISGTKRFTRARQS